MPASNTGLTGMGQAELRKLEDGEYSWTCMATNDMGSDTANVTFTGEFSGYINIRIITNTKLYVAYRMASLPVI